MLRVLNFEGYPKGSTDAPHKRYFDMIWFAIMAQGNPRSGGATGRVQIKQARRIKVEFRSVGQRLPGAEEGVPGRDAITLSEDGGQVALTEDDFKKVLELIEQVPWKGGNLDDVEDALEWLDAVPQLKSKEVKAAIAGEPAAAAEGE